MKRGPRIAVLGAGIMGSSLALTLSRLGADVTLVDAAPAPLARASRWNEGKIHLGYLYAADGSMDTAEHVLTGGLEFRDRVEALIGTSITDAITPHDDLYLVHRESVVDTDAMSAYFANVTDIVRAHPKAGRYLTDVSHGAVQQLSRGELANLVDTEKVAAGFRVPERSVSTNWIADRLVDALHADPFIKLAMGTRVSAAERRDDHWHVGASNGLASEQFDVVVNALWEGRLAVDQSLGLTPDASWSHRYRVCLFVHTAQNVDVPSAVLATGPFGDVKNYNGRDFYISWYPAGLIAEGDDLSPPDDPVIGPAGRRRIQEQIVAGLGDVMPGVHQIMDTADAVTLDGGWVFAVGKGALSDPASGLHRRDRFGVHTDGNGYYSIDTGKYSTAPWMAYQLADRLMSESGAR